MTKYWKPINSYGYRDIEHVNLKEKKLPFVVGDSFVAGHGIKNYKDLFSNVCDHVSIACPTVCPKLSSFLFPCSLGSSSTILVLILIA